MPLETQPVGDGRDERLYWPCQTEDSVVLGGESGSEMVLLIGTRRHRPDYEATLVRTIEQAIASEESWPAISSDLFIQCSRDDVQAGSAERIPLAEMAGPVNANRQFEKTVQCLRRMLRDECDYLLGEAFFVMGPETPAQPPDTTLVNLPPDDPEQPVVTAPPAVEGPTGPIAAEGHVVQAPAPQSGTDGATSPTGIALPATGDRPAAAVGQSTAPAGNASGHPAGQSDHRT